MRQRVVFAPHWAAPDRIVHALKRGVPLWVIGVVFVLFALLAFIGLRWVLERQTQTAQGDAHHGAAHTWASVSGKTTSWYTHEGGAKVYAANGAVTLRAHTDELQILADKDVTIISVNARRAVHRDLR